MRKETDRCLTRAREYQIDHTEQIIDHNTLPVRIVNCQKHVSILTQQN